MKDKSSTNKDVAAAEPNVMKKGGKNATTSTTPTGTLRGYWKAEEETALRAAVQKHGIGAWEKMRTDPDFKALRYVFVVGGDVPALAALLSNSPFLSFLPNNFFDFFFVCVIFFTFSLSLFHTHTHKNRGRTGVQLKDKWRNLIKFQHLRRGEIESAPYKATVRAKQNAAAAAAKGISGKTKATKSGGASGKTAGAGKKRNATADQGGNAAKNKGKTNAAGGRGFKKGTNNNDNNNLMDAFQKGPKGKRSKIARGGRFGGSADGTDSIDNNVSLDHLTNGGEGIGRSISPALPPKKQAFKQQKKKMKLLAEARQKAGTPDAKARALHAPSNAPPRKRVAAAWAAGISDVNQIGSRGLLNSNINSLDEDEQDILGAHLGHVTFDLDGDDNAHHLATTSGRGQNKKGAPSSASMAQFTEEMEREIEQTKERRAQMVRDVEYSETELARLKSLVEEAEKVYSQARQKAQETLQQAQKEIAEKRRKQSMESLEEQKKVAAPKRESDQENKDTKKNDVNKNNDDDDDENNINKSKGAATRKSLEASKQPSATIKDEKVDDDDDDEPSNEDVSPKSVPNLNDVEDIEVDDAEWDKYLAFGGDNANDDEDEDMSEMQRAAQIASDEKKRKKYATDSEMNKSPKSPRLRSQAGNNSHRDAATKETTPATTITTALEQNRRQQQQQYQFIPSNPNEHYDTDDWDDDLSSDDEDDEELDEEQLVSKAAWEKAQTALARAGLPPMQEIENVLLQELKRLEQANTKLVHARLALEACDSELSELFARAEARKAGVYNEDDDLREQTTNTGSLPSDLQNIHTDDEEDDDLQVVDNKRKNTHDGDNDEEDDEDDDDDDNDNDNDDDDDDDDDDDGKGEEQEEEMKKSTRSGGAKKTVERDNTRKKLRSREPQDGNEKKNERSSPVGKKGGKRWDDGNAQKGEENEEEKTVGKQKVTAGANKNKLANSRNKQQVDQKDSKKKSGGSGQKSGSGGGSGRGGSGFRSVSEDRRFGIYDARRYRSVEENDRDAQMNGGKINFALGGSNTASAANTQNSTGVSNNYESGEKNRRFAKGKGKSGGQQRGRAVSIGRGGGGSANAKASSYKESAMAFAATHWPQELKRRRDNSARKKRVKLGKSLWE